MKHEGRPERRRAKRAALRLAVAVRDEGGGDIAAQLIDIATHGCRIQCPSAVAAGSRLRLDIAGLDSRPCRVVWTCEEFAGLEFEQPLADPELERLLEDQRQLPETGIKELRDIAARTHGLARHAGDAEIHALAELSRACAVDALVEGFRLGEGRRRGPGGTTKAPSASG
jgi:hypothetical protein